MNHLQTIFLPVGKVGLGLSTGGDQYGSALANLSTTPGTITSQSNYPREIQFGLRINY
jgi:hypothetical protein